MNITSIYDVVKGVLFDDDDVDMTAITKFLLNDTYEIESIIPYNDGYRDVVAIEFESDYYNTIIDIVYNPEMQCVTYDITVSEYNDEIDEWQDVTDRYK